MEATPAAASDVTAERIRRGDQAALAGAFDSLRERLLRVAEFRLDPRIAARVSADDVLQESFLAASKRAAHLEGDSPANVFIWLRLIVAQTAVDLARTHLHAARRDAKNEVPLPAAHRTGDTGCRLADVLAGSLTSPTEALRRDERTENLLAALARMNETDREVLALRHFEELHNSEVAAVLGLEQKTASMRYFRALRRLKEIMQECGLDSTRIVARGRELANRREGRT